jgi:hypothetical protein
MASRRQRNALASLLVVLCALIFAGSAAAGQDIFITGNWVNTAGVFGPRHSLIRVTVDDPYDTHSCLNAWNDDNSGWAGTTLCSTGLYYHAYCGCKLRKGWAGDDPTWAGDAFIGAYQDW